MSCTLQRRSAGLVSVFVCLSSLWQMRCGSSATGPPCSQTAAGRLGASGCPGQCTHVTCSPARSRAHSPRYGMTVTRRATELPLASPPRTCIAHRIVSYVPNEGLCDVTLPGPPGPPGWLCPQCLPTLAMLSVSVLTHSTCFLPPWTLAQARHYLQKTFPHW